MGARGCLTFLKVVIELFHRKRAGSTRGYQKHEDVRIIWVIRFPIKRGRHLRSNVQLRHLPINSTLFKQNFLGNHNVILFEKS